MTQKKTTLIIGAGASHEVGLPLGSHLKGQIRELLDFEYDYEKLRKGSLRLHGYGSRCAAMG